MKSVSISGSLRENVGKKDAKAQRRQGFIPCVIYGGKEQKTFTVDEKQFKDLLYTPEVKFAEINISGTTYTAIVQASQYHPITDKLLHVDFLEVVDGKPITIELPMKITGSAPGVLKGGFLHRRVRKLKVRGLLKDIPEFITADISKLEINDAIKVGDLHVDNLTFVERPTKITVAVTPTRNVIEDTTATATEEGATEEGAAPAEA